jgi:hypothetical protein
MRPPEILQARSSFVVLQVLDRATTLVAFHYGAFEVNPLVGHLTATTGGVLFSLRNRRADRFSHTQVDLGREPVLRRRSVLEYLDCYCPFSRPALTIQTEYRNQA